MIQTRVAIRNVAPLVRALEAIRAPQQRTLIERALLKSAFLVQRIATTEKIRHGARKSPPVPDRLTSRSAGAGLVGSIGVDRSQLPLRVAVGSALRYAALHETGGIVRRPSHRRRTKAGSTTVRAHSALYPRRPYLLPALADAAHRFPAFFLAELEHAVEAAR